MTNGRVSVISAKKSKKKSSQNTKENKHQKALREKHHLFKM
jgi:hypothetical protein